MTPPGAGRFSGLWLLPVCLLIFFYPLLDGATTVFPADALYFFPPWTEHKPPELRSPGNFLLGYDQALVFLPMYRVMRDALAQGGWPLWNPGILFGMPFMANPQTALLYPLHWLPALFPLWLGLNLQAVGKLWLAGFFAYRWMKLFTRAEPPAVFAAAGFMFCSFNIVWLNHPHSNVSVLLPAGYYAAELIARRAGWRGLFLLAGAVCLQLFGGHVKSVFNAALGTGVYFLCRLAQTRAAPRLPRLAAFFCAYGLGALLAAAQLLPFGEYLGSSYTLEAEAHAPRDTLDWPYLLLLWHPDLLGHPAAGRNWGSLNYNEGAVYLGWPVLFLLCLGAGALLRRGAAAGGDKEPLRLAAALMLQNLLWGALIFGAPPVAAVAAAVPGLGSTDWHRLLQIAQLNSALAAGLVLRHLLKRAERANCLRPAIQALAFLAAAGAALLAFYSHGRELDWNWLAPRLGYGGGMLALCAGIALAFARGKLNPAACAWGFCLALFIDLFLAHRDYNPLVDKRWLRAAPPVELSASGDGPTRVTGLEFVLPPNLAAYAGWHDTGGYELPLYLPAHRFFAGVFAQANLDGRPRHLIGLANANELRLLQMLNVRHIFSRSPLPFDTLRLAHTGPDFRVYENPDAWPRAFLASAYDKATAAEIRAKLRVDAGDWRKKIYLEEDLPPAEREQLSVLPDAAAPPAAVRIVTYGNQRVEIDVDTAAAALLVLTDTDYPGWKAFVDGKQFPIRRANTLFRAVFVEPGRRRVEFIYQPPTLAYGIALSLVTAAGMALYAQRRARGERAATGR